MTSTHVAVVLLSLLSCVTAFLGVLLAVSIRDRPRTIAVGLGFSAGIMIIVSAVELIPQAHDAVGARAAFLSVGLGAAVLWFLNLVLPHTHLAREHGLADTRLVRSAYLVVAGLILHDVPEGFAMANAYIASPSVGLLVALAIALHNLPEEVAMAVPALVLRSRRFLLGAAVLSALAEPFGAVVGLIATDFMPALNGYFLAFAAGAMGFVAVHELAPMARRDGHLVSFAGGIALGVVGHRLLAFAITG